MDAHFHISNYAAQGVSLKTIIDRYMGDRIIRGTVMALPLVQKWDGFEHYAQDQMRPNYYLGPKAEVYYYAFGDAMLAREYAALSSADQARLDPTVTGFNPMDLYAPQHIKRVLLTFPGVFSGIGEFTVHKEVVSNKIAGDPIEAVGGKRPPDVAENGKVSLYSPALVAVLDTAAEIGLVATLHNDIYETDVGYDGAVHNVSPGTTYVEGLKYLCAQSPRVKLVWAHTGLGRFVKPTTDHLARVTSVLEACPNWSVDLAWDLVQQDIVSPKPGMPSLDDWARFITHFQDRVLWGSDTVMFTRDAVDETGTIVRGAPISVADYRARAEILKPLWVALGPAVSRKVKIDNAIRLYDDARVRVRAWEAAHSKDDVWNLPSP